MTLVICFCVIFSGNAEEIVLKTLISEDGKIGKMFLEKHPEVNLVEPANYYMSTTEIYQAILTGEYEGDVFPLTTSIHNVTPLMEKGYCLDLTGSELIEETVERLYPAFREMLTVDGKIYGAPTGVWFDYYVISEEAWQAAGMPADLIPDTLDELFDCAELFCDKLEDKEFEEKISLLSSWDATVYTESSYGEVFTGWIVENYIMQLKYAELEMNFDPDVLVPLLNRGRELGKRLYELESHTVTDESKELGLLDDRSSSAWAGTAYDPIVFMRITDDEPKLISAQLSIWSAFAQTEYPELCVELLEDILKMNSEKDCAFLFTDAEPVVNPNYESDLAEQRAFVEQTQKKLENPDLDWAERQDLEENLAKQQRVLDILLTSDDEKYVLSPDKLKMYQETIGNYLYFEEPNFFSANGSQGSTLENLEKQFAAGVISAEQFINELNRISRMIQAEGE